MSFSGEMSPRLPYHLPQLFGRRAQPLPLLVVLPKEQSLSLSRVSICLLPAPLASSTPGPRWGRGWSAIAEVWGWGAWEFRGGLPVSNSEHLVPQKGNTPSLLTASVTTGKIVLSFTDLAVSSPNDNGMTSRRGLGNLDLDLGKNSPLFLSFSTSVVDFLL